MQKLYLLKKMQRDGYYLRHTIQKKTKKSFGIQMMTPHDRPFIGVSHRNFDTWLDNKYIEKSTTRQVPGAKDLKFTYYVLNKNYQFDLNSFGLSLDGIQVNWQNYTNDSLHTLITREDWNTASQLILRTPPLFTLDEILILAKFLIPVQVVSSEYSYFEQYASFTDDIPVFDSILNEMYDRYLLTAINPVQYDTFHEALEAFVNLAKVRRFVRQRR
jgi:hypothetical protein